MALVSLAAVAAASQASLLVNGGFELPGSTAWNHYHNGEVPGWTTGQNDVMEIGKGMVYGVTGYEGLNMLEIDSTQNVVVSQSVSLAPGQYKLTFLSARRSTNMDSRPADTCDFDVLWNNQVVASLSPSSSAMALSTFVLNGQAGSNTVSFRGMGTSDGMGAILDDVRLDLVPEPASLFVLGLGLASVVRKRRGR